MKAFLSGTADFFRALARTARELADSKKAVLAFIAIAVPVAAELLPQYAPQLNRVAPTVDGVLVLLIALIGLIDALEARAGGAG